MPFWWKWPFWPQWPHRDLWPHHHWSLSSGQGTGHFVQVWSESDVEKYVKKACCQKERKKKERKKEELDTFAITDGIPCRQNWSQVDLDPMNEIESLKTMHIYELHGYTMLHRGNNTMYSLAEVAFLLKITFWPQWPQMTSDWHLNL